MRLADSTIKSTTTLLAIKMGSEIHQHCCNIFYRQKWRREIRDKTVLEEYGKNAIKRETSAVVLIMCNFYDFFLIFVNLRHTKLFHIAWPQRPPLLVNYAYIKWALTIARWSLILMQNSSVDSKVVIKMGFNFLNF